MMTYTLSVLLNKTNTEIEINTDFSRLSKEEITDLSKVLWDYSLQVEGTFKLETDADGWITWTFFLYVLDHGTYSDSYTIEEVHEVKDHLVELITKTLPSKSIVCIGFDN